MCSPAWRNAAVTIDGTRWRSSGFTPMSRTVSASGPMRCVGMARPFQGLALSAEAPVADRPEPPVRRPDPIADATRHRRQHDSQIDTGRRQDVGVGGRARSPVDGVPAVDLHRPEEARDGARGGYGVADRCGPISAHDHPVTVRHPYRIDPHAQGRPCRQRLAEAARGAGTIDHAVRKQGQGGDGDGKVSPADPRQQLGAGRPPPGSRPTDAVHLHGVQDSGVCSSGRRRRHD